ncbi:hypothetical protein ACIBHX_28140 [Nonomuraea sp. NPDC050536]
MPGSVRRRNSSRYGKPQRAGLTVQHDENGPRGMRVLTGVEQQG